MRLAILVGAGASYGAFDNPKQRPPLGNDLYPKLVDTFPATWGSLPEGVAAQFIAEGAGFELGMAALREEAEHTQAALIDMGIFFASFRLLPGTNRYLALAKILEFLEPKLDYAFASLNYETYLEQSLARIGRKVVHWGSPPLWASSDVVRVIKPHGSCNFVVDLGDNTFRNIRIVGGQSYIGGPGARLKVIPLDAVAATAETGFPPAMSLYAPGKPNLICPEFVDGLRREWSAWVDAAEGIVIVGARPMFESDPHIWDPILRSNAPVAFMGGDDESLRQFSEGRLTIVGDTFAVGLEPLKDWMMEL